MIREKALPAQQEFWIARPDIPAGASRGYFDKLGSVPDALAGAGQAFTSGLEFHPNPLFQPKRKSSLMKSQVRFVLRTFCALTVFAASPLPAVDYAWLNPASGGWSVPANWGSALSPNAPDANAAINATGGAYTISLGTSIALNNLAMSSADATLGHTAGTMSLGGVATLSAGRYYLNGGTISGGTIEQNGGVLDFGSAAGNTLDGVAVNGGIAIALNDGSVRFINDSVFNGNAILDGTSNTLFFGEDATIDDQSVYLNGAGSRLRVDGDWDMDIGSNGAVYLRGESTVIDSADGLGRIRNAGRIVGDGTSNTISIVPGHFENTGSIEIRDGSVARIGDGLSNTVFLSESVVDVRDGGVRLGGNWSNRGTIELENSDLWLGGTFGVADIGTLVRDGTSNTILVGEVQNGGGNWDLASSTGDVRLGDCTITSCTVTQGEGGRFLFDDGSVRFINDSVVQGGMQIDSNDGSVRFINGSRFDGSAIVDGASNTILIGESITLDDQEFHLNGAGNVLGVDGNYTVTLGPDAKVYMRGGATRIADDIYAEADPVFINYGLIEAAGAGSRYIELQDFRNRGDVRVNDGAVLEVGDGTSNTFLFRESRVILDDGSVKFISESVNEGLIDANSSSIEIDGSFIQNDGAVRFVSSTIQLADGASATIAGGEFRGTGNVVGDIDCTGGTFAPGDALGSLAVTGNLTVTNAVVLAFELDAIVPGISLIAVGGTFTIGSGVIGFNNFLFTNSGGLQEGTYVLVGSGGISGSLDSGDLSGDLGGFIGTLGIVGDDLVLSVVQSPPTANTFPSWITGFDVGVLDGFNDDPDGDGIANGLEYFFGTDPSKANSGVIDGAVGENTFTFTHPQNADLGQDVLASYRWSKDLVLFNHDGETDGEGTTVDFSAQVDTPEAGITTVTATISGTPARRLFVAIKVSGIE